MSIVTGGCLVRTVRCLNALVKAIENCQIRGRGAHETVQRALQRFFFEIIVKMYTYVTVIRPRPVWNPLAVWRYRYDIVSRHYCLQQAECKLLKSSAAHDLLLVAGEIGRKMVAWLFKTRPVDLGWSHRDGRRATRIKHYIDALNGHRRRKQAKGLFPGAKYHTDRRI